MLTTIATFLEPWEAHLFRLRLDAEGIPAFVTDEHHISVNWPYSLALGGVKVQVPSSAGDDARVVWKRCVAGEYAAELDREFGIVDRRHCPSCGSENFRRRAPWPLMAALMASFLLCSVIFPPGFTVYRCRQCGDDWSD